MTRPGRPNLGAHHIDGLSGSASSKERVRVILETVIGKVTVKEGCEILGVSPARFAELRTEALQAAILGLEPKPVGRPRRRPSEADAEIAALKERVRSLEEDLVIAEARGVLGPGFLGGRLTVPPRADSKPGDAASRAVARKKGVQSEG